MAYLKDEPLHVGSHIDPATLFVLLPDDPFEIEFTLPEHKASSSLPAPMEYGRRTCWGWRLRSNNYVHNSDWRIADSREQCLEAAKAYCDKESIIEALDDVRDGKGGII